MYNLTKKELERIILLFPEFDDSKTFVETGTYEGKTIMELEPLFDKLYTIDIKQELYQNALAKFNKNKNKVVVLLGESERVLPFVCIRLKDKTIFYLDAHYSSGTTGRGDKDVPILEEVQCINKNFNHPALIIINDARLFKSNDFEDWSQISDENILDQIDSIRINRHCIFNDRFIISLNQRDSAKTVNNISTNVVDKAYDTYLQTIQEYYNPQIEILPDHIYQVFKRIKSFKNCNLLVFGVGNDSALWHNLNKDGRTVFLENIPEWTSKVKEKNDYLHVLDLNYHNTESFYLLQKNYTWTCQMKFLSKNGILLL